MTETPEAPKEQSLESKCEALLYCVKTDAMEDAYMWTLEIQKDIHFTDLQRLAQIEMQLESLYKSGRV